MKVDVETLNFRIAAQLKAKARRFALDKYDGKMSSLVRIAIKRINKKYRIIQGD